MRVEKRYCDICGKELTGENRAMLPLELKQNSARVVIGVYDVNYAGSKLPLDLCWDCFTRIIVQSLRDHGLYAKADTE